MDIAALRVRIEGEVIDAADANYESVRTDMWNQLKPDRYPDLIVRVKGDKDVVEAVRFARENRLKLAVRGGGHSWSGLFLRNGGMLIDLSKLDQVAIDPTARTAAIQPFVSNEEFMRQLAPHKLAFPVGHCPQVKASGYLLSGGIGWNASFWGQACLSVVGVELVTAEGRLITANSNENPDFFWAARGGGAGLFAVVTRYHLKLFPLPQAITSSAYYYPLDRLQEVAEWVSNAMETVPRNVELTMFLLSAPSDLTEQCKSAAGKVFMITATAFAETLEEGASALATFESCPFIGDCLRKSVGQPVTFDDLFALSGSMWPENLRNKAETLWSNSSPADLLCAVRNHLIQAPNRMTLVLFAIYPGWTNGVPSGQEVALSKAGRAYGGPWTMWDWPEDDSANIAWHHTCCEILSPFAVGRYVGESDIIDDHSRAEAAFARPNWERLQQLREKYDPDGLFHGLFGGLS
jgi:FAD/FMN-containing dehydrogenase